MHVQKKPCASHVLLFEATHTEITNVKKEIE